MHRIPEKKNEYLLPWSHLRWGSQNLFVGEYLNDIVTRIYFHEVLVLDKIACWLISLGRESKSQTWMIQWLFLWLTKWFMWTHCFHILYYEAKSLCWSIKIFCVKSRFRTTCIVWNLGLSWGHVLQSWWQTGQICKQWVESMCGLREYRRPDNGQAGIMNGNEAGL